MKENAFALCNFKSPPYPSVIFSPEKWLQKISAACGEFNFPVVISKHPHSTVPANVSPSSEEFSRLLVSARVLITPPSTVIIEALAHRIPVILFNEDGKLTLNEFSNPDGAFVIATDENGLMRGLEEILQKNHSREYINSREYAIKLFLDKHLSYDPDFPAWSRITNGLIQISKMPNQAYSRLEYVPAGFLERNTGRLNLDNSVTCSPGEHLSGHCLWGDLIIVEKSGLYSLLFDIDIDSAINPLAPCITLEVYENCRSVSILATKTVTAADNKLGGKDIFLMNFEAFSGDIVEARIFWYGIDSIAVHGVYFGYGGSECIQVN